MKLIILDRDGVINQDSDNYIKSPEEWIPIPGSLEAIGRLTQHDYTIAVATNQSGIARGYYSKDTLQKMHDKMAKLLEPFNGRIDAIFYCPHGPNDHCDCRKPKPGLYLKIAEKFNVSLEGIYVVGDSFRDLEAAMAVNAKPILVKTGKGLKTLNSHQKELNDNKIPVFANLRAVIDYILPS